MMLEEKKTSRNGFSGYFVWIMVIMGIVHIVDVFVSNVGALITTAVATTFFPLLSLEDAVAKMTIINTITIAVMLLQPLIKVLTDRFGRKPMILATILGMSIGNGLQGAAKYIGSYWVYVIGGAVASYFLFADIQLLFIAEESPKKSRGFWILFTIFLGNLGTLLVPFAKGILISDDFSRNDWQYLYLISAGLGIILFFVMMFSMKESKAYTTAKELGELEIKSGKRFSFFNAVRDLRRSDVWKTFVWYMIVMILFMIPTLTYRSYTDPTLTSFLYSESEKNTILYIRITFSVIWFLISGKLADWIGRKKVLVLDQIMFLAGEVLFLGLIFATHNIWGIGIAWGMMFAGAWGFMNLNVMATNEVVPTKLRSTANGFAGLLSIFGGLIPILLFAAMLKNDVPFWVLYIVTIPLTIALIPIVIVKYKETKGAVLEEIKE